MGKCKWTIKVDQKPYLTDKQINWYSFHKTVFISFKNLQFGSLLSKWLFTNLKNIIFFLIGKTSYHRIVKHFSWYVITTVFENTRLF